MLAALERSSPDRAPSRNSETPESGTRPRRGRPTRTTISLSDIEAARITAATTAHLEKKQARERQQESGMEEFTDSNSRHRRNSSSSSGGKRRKRSDRSGTIVSQEEVEAAGERLQSRRSSERSSRHSEEYATSPVDGYSMKLKRNSPRKSHSQTASSDSEMLGYGTRGYSEDERDTRSEAGGGKYGFRGAEQPFRGTEQQYSRSISRFNSIPF